MARTELLLDEFVPNGALADPGGTAGNADGHFIAAAPEEEIVLRAEIATAATDVTIVAGDNPPALSAGYGDYTENCPIGITWLGPFTSARFTQADGSLHINVGTAANATLTAFHLPRRF